MRRMRGGGIWHEGVCRDAGVKFDMKDGKLDWAPLV